MAEAPKEEKKEEEDDSVEVIPEFKVDKILTLNDHLNNQIQLGDKEGLIFDLCVPGQTVLDHKSDYNFDSDKFVGSEIYIRNEDYDTNEDFDNPENNDPPTYSYRFAVVLEANPGMNIWRIEIQEDAIKKRSRKLFISLADIVKNDWILVLPGTFDYSGPKGYLASEVLWEQAKQQKLSSLKK